MHLLLWWLGGSEVPVPLFKVAVEFDCVLALALVRAAMLPPRPWLP